MMLADWARKLLPIEWLAMLGLFTATQIVVTNPEIRFFFPDSNAVSFTMAHYLGPMVPAMAIPLVIATVFRARELHGRIAKAKTIMLHRTRQCLALTFIVYIHFNFKLWAQLLNDRLYDSLYYAWDSRWHVVINSIEHVNFFLVTTFRLWPNAYHDIFVLMFMISLAAHAMQRVNWIFDRVVLALALVLALGGLSYAIAPALGPFIYGAGTNPFTMEVQAHMAEFQKNFVSSGGESYQPEFFVAAVAAMPSLHIAHVLVLHWYAFRHVPVLGFAYIIPSVYILSEAIASRWHYLADIPAGTAIAVLCITISNLWLPVGTHDHAASDSFAD